MKYLNAYALTHKQAVGLLLVAAVLWSLGGLLIKYIAWHSMAISSARSLVAVIVIGLVFRVRTFHRTPEHIGAVIAYCATVVLFVMANKMTTSANAILLQYTAPMWVAVFSLIYLGEHITMRDGLVIGVVFVGMTLFFVESLSWTGFLGNIVAIMSGIAFGWFTLFSRKQRMLYPDSSPIESVFWGNVLAGIIGLPILLQQDFSIHSIGVATLTGVVQLALPYIGYMFAMKRVTALEASVIPSLEAILNPVWVLLLFGETPGLWALIGGAVVLSALTIYSVFKMRHPLVPG